MRVVLHSRTKITQAQSDNDYKQNFHMNISHVWKSAVVLCFTRSEQYCQWYTDTSLDDFMMMDVQSCISDTMLI